MLIGLALAVISLILGLLKKQDRDNSFLILVNLGWLALIFVSVKFLPIQMLVLAVAILLTIIAAFSMTRTGTIKKLFPALIPISIGLFFIFLPTHERYKLISIKWNHEIETDYITLDKYSWFLYQNGEFAEALEVSNKAKNIANKLGDREWEEFIDAHNEAIEERNWKKYR